MGRRKLPSLPSGSSILASTSNTTSAQGGPKYSVKSSKLPYSLEYKDIPLPKTLAEITYNAGTSVSPLVTSSSRTLPLSYRESTNTAQTRFITTKASIPTANYSYSNSSSRSASPSTSLFYSGSNFSYSIDPTIIPGEIFKITSKNSKSTRPTIMSINNNTDSQFSSGKKAENIPLNRTSSETISQLMYKKELREALNTRRQSLEACEIEANHRQYMINRMLNSGLMPTHRSLEIESIPSVTKCTLSRNLIKGAKIVPQFPKLNTLPIKLTSDSYSFGTKQPFLKYNVQNYNLQQSIKISENKKSVACQFDSTVNEKPITSIYSLPLTSLKFQLKNDNLKQYREQRDSKTQTDKIAETQTDLPLDAISNNENTQPHMSFFLKQGNEYSKQHFNKKLQTQENYDKTLRKCMKRFDKHRFEFTDSQNINDIENKRREVQYELDQRRNKISSMIDLRYLQEEPLIGYSVQPYQISSSDYASTVPHYGSLPRIDYPETSTRSRMSIINSKVKNRYLNYGSLPRNYERYLSGADFYKPSISNRFVVDGSSSLYNLNQLKNCTSDAGIRNSYNFPSRSLNYLNQPTNYLSPSARQKLFTSYKQQVPYSLDTSTIPTNYYGENMLSQYANYLNNQFLLNQQQELYPNFSEESPLNIKQPFQSDIIPIVDESFDYNLVPPLTRITNSEALPSPIISYSNMNSLSFYKDCQRTNQQNIGHVYSRNENNYGTRPIKYTPCDYGNYLHNKAQSLQQLDNLQDFINHNSVNKNVNQTVEAEPYHQGNSYFQQPLNNYPPSICKDPRLPLRYSEICSNPEDSIIDGLNRVMHQYSRNSSANFQRQPAQSPTLYNDRSSLGMSWN